ncbi:Antibiotic biosynthesis monooxygenase [Novipirellula aureliae]|uniref:Antibiotic biosynthesis monooxygenase n=1 Tax=Novipirellula aureliae TaxID=2527966 RepID=A0A5C6DX11_9BACT|nr:antibiotic biosynthesis monooxygenase [Novipirellula aureliae]TWU41280.1 Antibiotic biosynthesis monooxygenase [Novipirellula aureliae]
MIIELTHLHVHPNAEARFEEAFLDAADVLSKADGYLRHSLLKNHDEQNQYLLVVHWQRKENSTIMFRESGRLNSVKSTLHRFYELMPETSYYEAVNLSGLPVEKRHEPDHAG